MKAATAEPIVMVVVVVVVIIFHFEREEDGEEAEREICILTTRRPARQWERKKKLITGLTHTRGCLILARDNAEILLAFP